MYKNFNLTDEERKQIMEMHMSHGYKKPLVETEDKSLDISEMMFNDGGEPMMTHNQFRDYSEPSYEEFDDYPYPDDNDNMNIQRDFINDIKSIGFYVETFNGQEYFIRCKEHEDFMIYFPNDETIEIYDTKNNEQKQEFGYEDAVDYVLKNKDNLLTFDESVRERNREMNIDSQDRINESRGHKKSINENVSGTEFDVVRGNPNFKTKTGRPVGDYVNRLAAAKQFQQDFQKDFADPSIEPVPLYKKDRAMPSGDSEVDAEIKRDSKRGRTYGPGDRSMEKTDPENPMGISVPNSEPSFTKKEKIENLEKKITALRLFKNEFGLDEKMTELYNDLLIKYKEDSIAFHRGGVK